MAAIAGLRAGEGMSADRLSHLSAKDYKNKNALIKHVALQCRLHPNATHASFGEAFTSQPWPAPLSSDV
jgi:hypothetical protein